MQLIFGYKRITLTGISHAGTEILRELATKGDLRETELRLQKDIERYRTLSDTQKRLREISLVGAI